MRPSVALADHVAHAAHAAAVVLAFSLLAPSGPTAAQVVRCVDAAGKVSYNDTGCDAGARRAEQLLGPEATDRRPEMESQRRDDGPRAAPNAAADRQPQPQPRAPSDGGLIVLDPRGSDRAAAQQRELDQQRRDEADAADRAARDAAYPYPSYPPYSPYSPYPGANRPPPARLPDMRPRLTQCGPSGCQDGMGNHYDRSGKVDRFVRPDGRSCRPVGTTVVC